MTTQTGEMSPKVLTVTVSPTLDVSMSVEALVPEHKLLGSDHRREPGGGGVNVARALLDFGVSVSAFVVTGGPIGQEIEDLLAEAGVPTVVREAPENSRESIAIFDRASRLQYRVVVEGPPAPDEESLAEAITAAATSADAIVLSGRLCAGMRSDFYRRIAERLEDKIVIVDCPSRELEEVTKGWATIVKPSRRELASLVDWVPANDAEIESAARTALDNGRVEALAVSLGAQGAVLVERGTPAVWYRPPIGWTTVSTVGAGDAMVAGITAGLIEGRALTDAVRLGVAAGTATTATPGTSLCRGSDAHRLEEQITVDGRSDERDGER